MRYFILFLAMIVISAKIFCVDNNDNISRTANFYNDEAFNSFKSVLNPENIFNIESGLSGELKYYLDFKWKNDEAAFQAADIGFLEEKTNSELSNRISEIFFSYHLWSCFIDAGKKKITQSVSFLKSPIDLILDNSKDLSKDKTYNLMFAEGMFMANIDLFTDFGVFGLSYLPELNFTNDAVKYFSKPQSQQTEFRYSVNLSGFDTGIAFSRDDIWRAGFNISTTIGDYIEAHCEAVYYESKTRYSITTNSVMTGYNPFLHQRIAEDLISSCEEKITDPFDIIIGGTYNADNFSVLAEYFYNQSGFNASSWNELRKTAKNIRQNYDDNPNGTFSVANLGGFFNMLQENGAINLCQNYGMIRIANPPSEKLSLSSTSVINLEDFSALEILSAGFSGWEHAGLTGNLIFCLGDDYSEFRLFGQDWNINIELEIDI